MTSPNATCIEGGYLVASDGWLPVLPADYRFGGRHPQPGCNHLQCSSCGATVASFVGFDVVGGREVEACALLPLGIEAALGAGAIVAESGRRLYVCECRVVGVGLARALDPSDGPDHPARALPWRCGGHPSLVLPTELDGEAIRLASLEGVVKAALAGAAPAALPWPVGPLDPSEPAAWLARLYALVPAGDARQAVAAAVEAAFASGDTVARAAALNFYQFHPMAPGASGVAELLRDRPAELVGVSLPWSRRRDLAELAWRVVEARLFFGSEATGVPEDAVALAVAKRSALEAAAGRPLALLRVGHWDRPWVLAQLAPILDANPRLAPTVVDVVAEAAPADAIAAFTAALAADGVNRQALGDAIRARFHGTHRDTVLTALALG